MMVGSMLVRAIRFEPSYKACGSATRHAVGGMRMRLKAVLRGMRMRLGALVRGMRLEVLV